MNNSYLMGIGEAGDSGSGLWLDTSGSNTDNGFNSQGSPDALAGWQNGDFNYDGFINGDDYTLIDNAYNSQGSVSYAGLSVGPTEMIVTATEQISAGANGLSRAVPEPTCLWMLGSATAGLLIRRRRR